MTSAIYPQGLVSWIDRLDSVDIDWAADINSLAAEVGATEQTLGTMPQVEKKPLAGTAVTYPSVDARISAIARHENFPCVSLGQNELHIDNYRGLGTYFGQFNNYAKKFDPFGLYNGTDVTVPIDGWYTVTTDQTWDWWSTGYHGHYFWIDDFYVRHHHWHWDFFGNDFGGWWQGGIGYEREAHTNTIWQGVLQAGQRLRVSSENGCPHTPHRTYNLEFQMIFNRTVPSGVS